MSDNNYHGWKNYETWNVELWIDNEQGSSEYWQEVAGEVWDDSEAGESYSSETRKEASARKLSDRLKDEFEDSKPEVQGMWADLLNAAMSEVDWYEIAENMLEEFEEEPAIAGE